MAEYCEVYDDGSWYCAYDDGSEQFTRADGSTQYIGAGSSVDWTEIIDAGTQAAIAILNRNGYSSPNYRPPTSTYNGPIPGVTASAGGSRSGVGGSLNISTNTLLLIGAGVMLFILGSKRGR